VPDTEVKDDFIIVRSEPLDETVKPVKSGRKATAEKPAAEPQTDEFDLSDITANPGEMTKEDIIAAAEAAAFAE